MAFEDIDFPMEERHVDVPDTGKFDAEIVAGKLRDSISGFETAEDQEETETDTVGSDLVADIPLDGDDED